MNALADLPDLLTPDEARRVLRVGRNQLYSALHRGEVPAIRVGRSWRIPRHALEALMNGDSPAGGTGLSESSISGRAEGGSDAV